MTPPRLIDARQLPVDLLAEAGALIRAGQLVAFPTETVYGLGANALDAAAVARIYAAKGRPSYNPIILHVAEADAAVGLVTDWPDSAAILSRQCWPGPLTLVLPAASHIPAIVRAGLPSVGIRVPAHPVALALLRAADRPIAAPSANRFTEISPTTAAHVLRGLGDRVPLILDGGPTTVGIESTVLDLTGDTPTVLRPGAYSADQLSALLGRPVHSAAGAAPAGEAPRASPGMVDRHYAPTGEVWLYTASEWEEVAAALADRRARGIGGRIGAIWRTPRELPDVQAFTLPDDPAGYAQQLYAALHALDAAGATLLLIERAPDAPEWDGVRDRIERASR